MELKEHKNMTYSKWSQFPWEKQILLIASELQRALNWLRRGDTEEAKLCYSRALELIYLAIEYLKNTSSGNRLREMLRLKEFLQGEYIKKEKSLHTCQLLLQSSLLLSPQAYNLLNPDVSGS